MQSNKAIVLIPSYEPEETLVNLTRGLKDLGFKVIVVNDGSDNRFDDIFKRAEANAEIISYSKNKGKGEALKTGFRYILEKHSDYDVVITADGDGQHRIKDIERISDKSLKKDKIIVAERKFDVKVPIKSKIGNDLSKFTQATATYRYLNDNQCGLRAFPMRYLKDMIRVGGSRYEYEMKVLSYLQNKEIDFETIYVQTIYENNNSTTHFRPIKDTLLIQRSLVALNLVNILLFALQAVGAFLFSEFVFKDNPFKYEIAMSLSFVGALLLELILKSIIYRPKNVKKLIFRVVLIDLLVLVAVAVSITLFTRVLELSIFLSYLFCYLLIIFPLFYVVKGAALVYGAQNSDDNEL